MRKPVLCYMRATDADQHAHLRMICVFVVRCIDTSMPIVATCIYEIPRLYLVSAAEQASLSITWLQAPEDVFLMTCLNFQYI